MRSHLFRRTPIERAKGEYRNHVKLVSSLHLRRRVCTAIRFLIVSRVLAAMFINRCEGVDSSGAPMRSALEQSSGPGKARSGTLALLPVCRPFSQAVCPADSGPGMPAPLPPWNWQDIAVKGQWLREYCGLSESAIGLLPSWRWDGRGRRSEYGPAHLPSR